MAHHSVIYFAYGSNLLHARLAARTPSLQRLGIAKLYNHEMAFTLPGDDDSGKCGIQSVQHDAHVLGVLYQLHVDEKAVLDEIERVGFFYQEKFVQVEWEGKWLTSFTYYPTNMSCQLKPYDWYKNFVLSGAKENNFPEYYVQRIKNIAHQVDPNIARRKQNFIIAGINHIEESA